MSAEKFRNAPGDAAHLPSSSREIERPRTKSEVSLRSYKTPFEPFLVSKLRFWPPHRVPRLLIPRMDLRLHGCTLEERLIAIHIDGVTTLDGLTVLTGLDLPTLAGHVGAMCERRVLQVD